MLSRRIVFALVQDSGADPSLSMDPDDEGADVVDPSSAGAANHVCQYPGCSRGFQYRRNLYRHWRKVHAAHFGAVQEMAFISSMQNCSETDPSFLVDPDDEGPDVADHISANAGTHVCQYDDCTRIFQYKCNLDRHQRKVHGALFGAAQQVAFFCSVQDCRRTFYCKSTLAKHQRTVHGFVNSDML